MSAPLALALLLYGILHCEASFPTHQSLESLPAVWNVQAKDGASAVPEGVSHARLALTARLQAQHPHIADHVSKELDRKKPPRDPEAAKHDIKVRGLPMHHETPWINNVTEAQLRSVAPSWHGFFVFKVVPGCTGCETALSVVEKASREAYQDHELRICASFTVTDSLGSESSLPKEQAATALHPVLYWIPPAHEQHAEHLAPTAFYGPWNTQSLLHFVNNKCARSARFGRVYVADVLAAQFSSALNLEAQRQVYQSFSILLWAHNEGRMNLATQQYMRYYAEIMEKALEIGYADHSYFQRESDRLWSKLQMEVHRDALSEVTAIRHNVIQAFMETAGHPMDIHTNVIKA